MRSLQSITFTEFNLLNYLKVLGDRLSEDVDVKRLQAELIKTQETPYEIVAKFLQCGTPKPSLYICCGKYRISVSNVTLVAVALSPVGTLTQGAITVENGVSLIVTNDDGSLAFCLPSCTCHKKYTSTASTCDELCDDVFKAILELLVELLELELTNSKKEK